ncbi:hypothetical protein OPT61_g6093 [Boeremia exigua]|uniref:Uncharacterized protein n=1 Tax=Boeremia exigua TaxID=749465 RepID=A0ACC2I801_9PLEO|nr:hypothetical protein OPT61_g6093 [Boeremia exigua]
MATFADLPPELRNSIYEMLLDGSAPNLSVLVTSPLLHEEAASYYYQNSALTIDLPYIEIVGETILPSIPDQYLRYIKHLSINMCLSTSMVLQADCARRIKALPDACPTLTNLTINLTSNTSRLLSARIDDSVLAESHSLTLALRHLLSSSAIQSVHLNWDGVWFAPHLATQLTSEFQGRLEILSSASSPERELLGQTTQTHLRGLGADAEEVTDLQLNPSTAPSTPASLSSALSELDHFSPIDFLDEDVEDVPRGTKGEKENSLSNESESDMQYGEDGIEEELTEEDDVEDEDMEDIDDFEAIMGNFGVVAQRAACEADVCYMTNFAPEMLGGWVEGSW